MSQLFHRLTKNAWSWRKMESCLNNFIGYFLWKKKQEKRGHAHIWEAFYYFSSSGTETKWYQSKDWFSPLSYKYCLACVRCDKMSPTVTKHSDSLSHSLPVSHSQLGLYYSERKRGPSIHFQQGHRSIWGGKGTGCHQYNTSKHKRQI